MLSNPLLSDVLAVESRKSLCLTTSYPQSQHSAEVDRNTPHRNIFRVNVRYASLDNIMRFHALATQAHTSPVC